MAIVAAAGLIGNPNPFLILMRRGHEGPRGHVRHEALLPSYPGVSWSLPKNASYTRDSHPSYFRRGLTIENHVIAKKMPLWL